MRSSIAICGLRLLGIGPVTCEVPKYYHLEGKTLAVLLYYGKQACSCSQGASLSLVRQEVCITFLGHSNEPDNRGGLRSLECSMLLLVYLENVLLEARAKDP